MIYLLPFILEQYTEKDIEDIASKYTSRKDFRNNEPRAYAIASHKKEFYKKITSHMGRLRRKPYSDEELKDIASKYSTIKDFKEKDYGAFQAIEKRGKDFYDKTMSHITRLVRKPYSDEELKDIANKYSTIKDFKEKDYGAYTAAIRRGEDFYSDIMSHMNRLRRSYTNEELEEIANKYDYKIDFFEKDSAAWAASRKKGKDFYEKITSHMDNKIRNNGFSNKEVEYLIDYLDKGESINNICKYMNMSYMRIVNKIHDLYRLDKLPTNARKNFELLNKKGEGKQIVLHRFTEKDIKKIIKLYNEGKSSKQISELTNHSRIGMIINLFKEAKELKNSRFSEDYKKEEIEDIINDNFNLNVFCEKWKRGHYEASIKRRQLLNKRDETKSYSIYTGIRLIKLIKNIAKTIKKEYDGAPKKHYVQSELYKSLKGINCSILTLLGPTPNRFINMLQKYDIIGDNDIYAYKYR